MKGLSAKKIAAIAAGVALVGTALAPFVSAMDLKKSDVYNETSGAPAVSVVVGSKAAISDVLWAGNIAAAIARNATASATATATATPSVCGAASGTWNPPTGMTVDLSVGGTTTLGAGSKQFKQNLSSVSGAVEVDHNALTNSTLTHLVNTTQTETVDNSQSTITAQETIGVNIDALFNTTSSYKDLLATIASGDYNYDVSLGTGITLDEKSNGTNYTYFADSGVADNVKVPFFGEWYTLQKADFNSATKNVTLNLTSAIVTINPNDEVTGLKGDGIYAGKEMKVKFVALSQSGSTNYAKFELYDANGSLVDTQTVQGSGSNLRQVFVNGGSQQGYSLSTDFYVNNIYTTSTASSGNLNGYVEITKGTGTVLLYDGKGYPYDPNDVTGIYDYVVSLKSSASKFTGYTIKNSRERWDASGVSNGPLYPSGSNQSLNSHAYTTAVFGQALAAGTAGKEYATVKFEGFDPSSGATISTVQIGKNPTSGLTSVPALDTRANFGGIYFAGSDDTLHTIPFALKLSNTGSTTWDTFSFDGQTIAYIVDATVADTNTLMYAGPTYYLNGHAVTVTDANGALITIDGVSWPTADSNAAFAGGTSFVLDSVTYTIADGNGDQKVYLTTDGYAQFRQSSSTGTILSSGSLDTNTAAGPYGKWFFSKNLVDQNATRLTSNVRLLGNNSKAFRYAQLSNGSYYWLVLDANKASANINADDASTIQKSHSVKFQGTATTTSETESALVQTPYYLPDSSDWNGSNYAGGDTKYQVAVFSVNDAATATAGDFNVYLNAEDGGLFTFPNTNLSTWSSDVDQLVAPTWSVTNGLQSNYLSAGWNDAGSKATMDTTAGNVVFKLASTLQQTVIDVLGKSVTIQTSGGEDLKLLKEGDTGTTGAGTKVTISKINYTPGTVTGADNNTQTVVVTPVTYMKAASWSGKLVYTDKDTVSGRLVIVGGPAVNAMAKGIADMAALKSAGQKVAAVDATTGNVLVAGYTAADTGSAAQEFISALDGISA